MHTQYVLIDYENVQPKDLTLLEGHPFKVVVFVGANQTKIPTEFADALQARGDNGQYFRIQGNGRNALDFHIAFHLGKLVARDPKATFHIISNDSGFDPLIAHLRGQGIGAQRSSSLSAVVPVTDERLASVLQHLARLGQARPRRVTTLANTINALFDKTLDVQQVEALVAALEKRGVISTKEGKVAYTSI